MRLLVPDAAPAQAAADAALRHAGAAAMAAETAGTALAGLGVRDAFAPADFRDLLARVPVIGPVATPGLPPPGQPAAGRGLVGEPLRRRSAGRDRVDAGRGRGARRRSRLGPRPGQPAAPGPCAAGPREPTDRRCRWPGGSRPRRRPGRRSSCTCSTWPATGSSWRWATSTPPTRSPSWCPGSATPRPTISAAWSPTPATSAPPPGPPRRGSTVATVVWLGYRPPATRGSDRHADGRLARADRRSPRRSPAWRPHAPRPAPGSRGPPSSRTATARWWSTRPPTCPDGSPPTPSCCSGVPGWRTTRRASRSPEVYDAASAGDLSSRAWTGSATAAPGRPASARPGCRSDPAMGHSRLPTTPTIRRWPRSGRWSPGPAQGRMTRRGTRASARRWSR